MRSHGPTGEAQGQISDTLTVLGFRWLSPYRTVDAHLSADLARGPAGPELELENGLAYGYPLSRDVGAEAHTRTPTDAPRTRG